MTRSYEFGRFRLDAASHVLYRDDARVALTPRAMDVLVALVENGGEAMTREALLDRVWSGAIVEEGTLSSHISLLRKTLGRDSIETIPKRGYRFAGTVRAPAHLQRSLLVVLPFDDLGGAKKSDAFSDGLTEEMISQLGRSTPERLGVIARTSSMAYKHTTKTIEQIGRELGVTHVLEGSVRRAGNRVRISAQLIQVSDQTHLWADNYESPIEDILALQRSVAIEVARQIHTRLLPADRQRRVVPKAWEAYLQGRHLWCRRGERDLRAAIRCFENSIAYDAAYAQPYAGIADATMSLVDSGLVRTLEGTARARSFAQQALAIDDSLADAHVSLGHAALHEFDWGSAKSEFLRAIELNPSAATARFYYSNYLAAMMRFDGALSEAEEARRLDPVLPATATNIASILWHARRFGEAAEMSRRTLQMHSDYLRAYEDLGRALEQMGHYDQAIRAFRKSKALASLAHAFALSGRRNDARKILRKLQASARRRFVSAWDLALINIALGNDDAAFAFLSKAYDERSAALPFLRSNPRLDPIRDDHRFRALVKRAGLA